MSTESELGSVVDLSVFLIQLPHQGESELRHGERCLVDWWAVHVRVRHDLQFAGRLVAQTLKLNAHKY